VTFDIGPSNAAAGRKTFKDYGIAKALGPTSGQRAVLGRYALGLPGDCNQARRPLFGGGQVESQEGAMGLYI